MFWKVSLRTTDRLFYICLISVVGLQLFVILTTNIQLSPFLTPLVVVSFLLFLLSSSTFPLQNSHEGKQAQLKKVAPSLLLPSLTGSRGELQRRDARRESSRAGGGGGGANKAPTVSNRVKVALQTLDVILWLHSG